MSIATDEITEVLNSIEALSQMEPKPFGDSAKDVLKSLADHCDRSYQLIHDIIRQRRQQPTLTVFMEMEAWRDKILAKVQKNNSERIGYRKALKAVKEARA